MLSVKRWARFYLKGDLFKLNHKTTYFAYIAFGSERYANDDDGFSAPKITIINTSFQVWRIKATWKIGGFKISYTNDTKIIEFSEKPTLKLINFKLASGQKTLQEN